MKSNQISSLLLVLFLFFGGSIYAQCPFTSAFFGSGVAPTTGNSATLQTCSFIGEVITATGVVAGDNYTINVTYSASQPSGVIPYVVLYDDTFAPIAWGDSTVSFTAPASGTYHTIPFLDSACMTYDPNFGCNATLWTNNGPSAGVTAVNMLQLEISPNPTSDIVSLHFAGEAVELEIMDSQGKVMYSEQIDNGKQIDLSPFDKGVYFFNLRTSEYTETRRIVLQ